MTGLLIDEMTVQSFPTVASTCNRDDDGAN